MRGVRGVYQHCGEQHLHCNLAEFDFRYNNHKKLGIDDKSGADNVVRRLAGKRLIYQRADAWELTKSQT
jgi:hypothetical protein